MPGLLGTGSFAGPFSSLSWGPATKFHISSIEGADDLPNLDMADLPRPVLDGSFRGHRRLDARTIRVGFTIVGTDPTDYFNQVQAFQNVFVPSDAEGQLLLFNSGRLFNAYVSRRRMAYDAGVPGISGEAAVEFMCIDPRMYDATLQQPTTTLPGPSGGFGFNFGFNLGFGGAGTGGIINANNAGSYPTPATLTIQGPATNPIVTNDTLGKFVKFLIVLSSTDVLTVDLDQRLVTLNGTGNRNNTVSTDTQWWLLQPGNNSVRFGSDVYSALASLTCAFRSAWA